MCKPQKIGLWSILSPFIIRAPPVKLFLMNNLRRTLLVTLPLIGSGSLLAQNAMNTGLHLGIDPISFFSSGSGGDGVPVVNARYMHRFDSDFDSPIRLGIRGNGLRTVRTPRPPTSASTADISRSVRGGPCT